MVFIKKTCPSNIPFPDRKKKKKKFSNQPHSACYNGDCSKCCEINTVSLTYGALLLLPWNNDSTIEKMNGWKWCHHITDFFQYMHASNQACIKTVIYDISLLQFLFCKNTAILKNALMQCSFIIKRGPIIVWMAATGIAN